MQRSFQHEGLSPGSRDDTPAPTVLEVPAPVAHDRSADELEVQSIKWNVARIVRLSSGRYALLTHYRSCALDLIKVGTLEEIAPFIPTAEQCIPEPTPVRSAPGLKKTADLLADLGL